MNGQHDIPNFITAAKPISDAGATPIQVPTAAPTTLHTLSDADLESRLKSHVAQETALTIQILHLLAEVENRRLYSRSYPSLFEYCTRELKYSPGSAQRRIDTMRAMKLIPEIEQKLESGALHLSTVAKAQSFFRQEQKTGKSYTPNERKDLLSKLEHKSAREVDKQLADISPLSAKPDQRREITANLTELRLTLPEATIQALNRLRELLSNKHPHLTDSELVSQVAQIALITIETRSAVKLPTKKLKPAAASNTGSARPATPQPMEAPVNETNDREVCQLPNRMSDHGNAQTNPSLEKVRIINSQSSTESQSANIRPTQRSRHIPAQMRNAVWHRDGGTCTHPGCHSKFRVQVDHVVPFAKGGQTSLDNLRLLCQTHNLLAAQREFGTEKMKSFWRKV